MSYLYPSIPEREAYYRTVARKYNIDPEIAVKVARSEGMQPGVFQSNVYKRGKRENSWGDWQLYKDGGLGNVFMEQTGLDPADPKNWKEAGDFALKTAAEKQSWGDWYGAGRVGIGKKQGFNSPMRLGPSGGNGNSDMDWNNLVDPTKLTPLQMAMLQAQGQGGQPYPDGTINPLYNKLTPEQAGPKLQDRLMPPMPPMQAAMSGPESMMNPSPVPPTPMQTAMGPGMDMAQNGPGGGDDSARQREELIKLLDSKDKYRFGSTDYIRRGLLGTGAALSSIDNPQGGAVALGLLKQMDSEGSGLSTYEALRLKQAQDRLEFDKTKDDNKPSTFAKKSEEAAVKRYMEMESEIEASHMQLGQIEEMEKHLNTEGLYTGPAGEEVNWLKAIGSVLDPDNKALAEATSRAEAVKALQNQQALGLRSPKGIFGGLTGNTSDRDVKFLLAGVAGIDKLPGANKLIIAAMRKIYQRRIDYNREAARWIEENGATKGTNGLLTHMDQWQKELGPALEGHFPNTAKTDSSSDTVIDWTDL